MRTESDAAALHDWAAEEAATLVRHFADTRTLAIARDLNVVRRAFDAAARSIDGALSTPPQADDEIRTFVARLTTHLGVDALRTHLHERDAENQILKAELTNARMELDAARAELEGAGSEAMHTATAQMTMEFERALEELRREHVTVVAQQTLASSSLPLDELLIVFSDLRKAATVPELLTALIHGLGREFSRIALFDVDGDRLVGSEQVGFDAESDISKVTLPLSVDSLLTRAVRTGRLESIITGLRNDPPASLPFGGTPACALAIPIVAQGATMAVIYADDSDHVEFATAAPQARAKFADLLQQHALLAMLRIWVEQKGVAECREFAARLATDLEHAYTVEAKAGRDRLTCQQRLKEDVETARRRYAERVAREDRRVAGLLDEHLTAALQGREDTAFGRDLAVLLGSAGRGSRANVVSMYRAG